MKLPRRKFLQLTAGAATAPAFPRFAWALDYPGRPVRLVVAFFAGSLSDILARTIADGLSKQLGQQIIVDDQPGAGGNLATDMVVRATPDGYTLLEATSANVWNAALYDKLGFDFIRDIAHRRRRRSKSSTSSTQRYAIYSALMPADLKRLPHFSLSTTINLPNSAGVIGAGTLPS
jgi:tripartite-type tricarboxylate transporter receptor subunit TctC